MNSRYFSSLLISLLLLAAPAMARGDGLPEYKGYVNDFAGTISPAQVREIEATCAELQRRTGAILSVVVVNSTQPYQPQEYAEKLFQKWQRSRPELDNGVLIVLSIIETQAVVRVGYRMQHIFKQHDANRVMNIDILPSLVRGRFGDAMLAGAASTSKMIDDYYAGRADPQEKQESLVTYTLLMISLVILVSILFKAGLLNMALGVLGALVGLLYFKSVQAVIFAAAAGFVLGYIPIAWKKIQGYPAVIVLLLLTQAAVFGAEPAFPRHTGFVNDYIGVMGAEWKGRSESLCREVKEKTGAELVIAAVKTSAPLDSRTYATKLFEEWKIGEKGKDNGILVLFAMEEKRVEIEVGYGLEGAVNDAKAGAILDSHVIPYFRDGNIGEGLYNGALALAHEIAAEHETTLGGEHPRRAPPAKDEGSNFEELLMMALFAMFFLAIIGISGIVAGIIGAALGGAIGFSSAGIIGAAIGAVIGFVLSYYRLYWIFLSMMRGGRGMRGGFGGFGGGRSGGGGAGRGW